VFGVWRKRQNHNSRSRVDWKVSVCGLAFRLLFVTIRVHSWLKILALVQLRRALQPHFLLLQNRLQTPKHHRKRFAIIFDTRLRLFTAFEAIDKMIE
jgi:hypothetical protein